MKLTCPAGPLARISMAAVLAAASGLGCFSPLLAGIGGGSALYQHETAKKSTDSKTDSASSNKSKPKQSATAKNDDSDLE